MTQDKTFHLPIAKTNENTTADGNRLFQFVDKRPRKREANGDIGKHETRNAAVAVRRRSFSCLPRLRVSCRENGAGRRDEMWQSRACRRHRRIGRGVSKSSLRFEEGSVRQICPGSTRLWDG